MASLPSLMPRLRRDAAAVTRVERVGWTAGTCIESYGVRIGIRLNDPRLLDRLVPHLPPAWKPARSAVVDRLFSLWIDPATSEPARPTVMPSRSRPPYSSRIARSRSSGSSTRS